MYVDDWTTNIAFDSFDHYYRPTQQPCPGCGRCWVCGRPYHQDFGYPNVHWWYGSSGHYGTNVKYVPNTSSGS